MATSIEEKLYALLQKLKETDHNLSVCIVLLQQYLRQKVQKEVTGVCLVAVLAVAAAAEEKKQEKRGLLGLGYGYGGLGLGHHEALPIASSYSLGHGLDYGYPAPLLTKAYAAPAIHAPIAAPIYKSYAAPIAAPIIKSYAAPIAAPIIKSYAAPAIHAPIIKSYAAPAIATSYAHAYDTPIIKSYAAPAIAHAPLSLGYGYGLGDLGYSSLGYGGYGYSKLLH